MSIQSERRGCRPRKEPLLEVLWLGVQILFLKTWKFRKRFYEQSDLIDICRVLAAWHLVYFPVICGGGGGCFSLVWIL